MYKTLRSMNKEYQNVVAHENTVFKVSYNDDEITLGQVLRPFAPLKIQSLLSPVQLLLI